MKPIYTYALLAAFAAVGQALAVNATTTPVGYVSLGNAGSVPANTDVFVTIPLLRSTEYVGSVASVSGNTITLAGTPGFTTNQFSGATPYVAVVESGSKSGLIALITANASGTLTVAAQPGETLASIVASDKISVRKAWTVSSFLSSGVIPVGAQLLAFSGTSPGITVAPDLIYEYDGSSWVDTNTFDGADNVVLYPGEGFVLRTPVGTGITNLSVSGDVPTAKHRVILPNLAPGTGQDSTIGYFSPVGELIGSSGLGYTGGDQLLVWSNSTSGIIKAPVTVLEYDGSAWVDTNSFDDVSATFKLEGGQSYVFRRASTAPGGDTVWTDTQTYVPTL